ncbi:hypothetical protein VIBNISOn1_p0116 [Vibrio nigripulchritudo SOn1]|uniref:Uncharacterized protein n=1 Tax=Vibrio nigripulchritudo SOn1 TaxID=1238450 RepID=A0AAV2VZT8_9VIBR|nr:hypothetical protein VIBNISOn1_p0116 [Vibrio nigripulchritudo SOn1]
MLLTEYMDVGSTNHSHCYSTVYLSRNAPSSNQNQCHFLSL